LYYQIINEPIDFQRIRRKIDTYRYSNLEELDVDIKLLVDNAQTFNCETSIIYSDSILLEKVYQNLRQQLQSGLLQIPIEKTNAADDSAITPPQISSRRERGARTIITPMTTRIDTTSSGVSRRGRKRKATVVLKVEDASEDEPAARDNEEN
jgi:hypothetical protein